MILAIDTSTEQASIALMEGPDIISEWSWRTGRNHSRHLTSAVEIILDLAQIAPQNLTSVVVASGPGSFSGVRVGVSFAKGLAMALHIPLVGISTLDAIAFQTAILTRDVWAAIPAGRGQLYLAHYGGEPQTWSRLSEYLLVSFEEAASMIDPTHLLVGPGAEPFGDEVVKAREAGTLDNPVFASPSPLARGPWFNPRRAGFLAELGRRHLASGGHDQLDSLEPLYLRQSSAEEKRAATQSS